MRKGKEELYEKEREEILIKVLKLIGIDKNNNRILRDNLEKPEINEYINEMMEEIKKYYSISRQHQFYSNYMLIFYKFILEKYINFFKNLINIKI